MPSPKNVVRFYGWLASFRKPLGPVLRWEYSGWIMAIAVPLGIAMAFLDQYVSAYICFVIGGVAAFGSWLTSDFLKTLRAVEIRRDATYYRLVEWAGRWRLF